MIHMSLATAASVAIGLLHGEVGVKDSRYRPIPLPQITRSGLDYLALGHVHACSGVQTAGATVYAYPGCPEGRGFDELGDKGFMMGEVDKGSVKLRFIPFARRRYEILTVDVTEQEPLAAIRAALPARTERDIYRILLTGETDGGVDIPAIIIKIDSADALARDNGTNGVVVIDFVVKVDLTVEVLTIFGEDDASAIFLRNDAGDHVAV